MELRNKFSIIALVYLASLVANVVLAAWCILVYFNSAFAAFDTELSREREIEEARGLVRRQASLLEGGGTPKELSDGYQALQTMLEATLARLGDSLQDSDPGWPVVLATARAKNQVARRQLAGLTEGGRVALSEADSNTFVQLDGELGEVSRRLNSSRQDHVQRAATTQSQVISILGAGAVLGAGLCLLGLISMRHWVVQPIGKIRLATRRIAQGDFDYRLPIDSDDELGRLSAEINHTCSTIQDMQRRLVEQERLAAAGEMFARLAHNIRNPLGSIRGLAEATAQQRPDDVEIVECQRRIINTVDRFEKWLRDMQQSVSPMSLNLRPTLIAEPLESVAVALGPLFDRRGVRLEIRVTPGMPPVLLDAAHFEQGLVALVTNAIQASAPGQRVRIGVRPLPETDGKWELSVEDQGPGIPTEIRDKVFLPCFTTKPDGHGLGLAMANKVVKIHGGDLTFESTCGQGTRFIAVFPGLVRERD